MSEKLCLVFNVITLSPKIFECFLEDGIVKRAQSRKVVKVNVFYLRNFAEDKHKVVDDYTFGGGVGMILKPEPIFKAVESINREQEKKSYVVLTSPTGVLFSQQKARDYSQKQNITIICGKYEGVDARVRECLVNEEVSIGDYILSSGEVPALVIIDAVIRLLPGALLKEEAVKQESFSSLFLEYPQYTRPRNFRGMKVPEVLLSGNHKEIERWRKYISLKQTVEMRPDLLDKDELNREEEEILNKIREVKE